MGFDIEVPLALGNTRMSDITDGTPNIQHPDFCLMLDPADYDGATYYFCIDGWNEDDAGADDVTVELYDADTPGVKSTIALPAQVGSSTSPAQLWAASAFTPTTGNTKYIIRTTANYTAVGIPCTVVAAYIIVVQADGTKTRIQVVLGSNIQGLQLLYDNPGTSYVAPSGTSASECMPMLWLKNEANWADVTGCSFEAVFRRYVTGTAYVALFNETDGTQVGSGLSSSTSTVDIYSEDFAWNATNFDDGDEFGYRVKNSSTNYQYLYQARLYVTLSNAGGLSKAELARNVGQGYYGYEGYKGERFTYTADHYSAITARYFDDVGAIRSTYAVVGKLYNGNSDTAELTNVVATNDAHDSTRTRKRSTVSSLTDGYRYTAGPTYATHVQIYWAGAWLIMVVEAYTDPPTITGLTPDYGGLAGGTSVVITGTNLTGATAVTFGAQDALDFVVDSATQITAISPPAAAAGTVNVQVTTPGGSSANTSADDFEYVAEYDIPHSDEQVDITWTLPRTGVFEYIRVAYATREELERLTTIQPGGRISRNADTDLKESGTLPCTEPPMLGDDFVRIYYVAIDEAGGVERIAIATMHAAKPTTKHTAASQTATLTLYSALLTLQQAALKESLTIDAEAVAVDEAVAICEDLGLPVVASGSTKELTEDASFEAGTNYLKVVNYLLEFAGFWSAQVDGYGRVVMKPYRDPALREPVYEFISGDEAVFLPEVTVDAQTFDVPNVVVLTSSNPDGVLVGTYQNDDPASPYSTATRGREIVLAETVNDAADQADIDARAKRRLLEATSATETTKVSHAFLPLYLGDVVGLAWTRRAIDIKASVQAQDLILSPAGLTVTTLKRVWQ